GKRERSDDRRHGANDRDNAPRDGTGQVTRDQRPDAQDGPDDREGKALVETVRELPDEDGEAKEHHEGDSACDGRAGDRPHAPTPWPSGSAATATDPSRIDAITRGTTSLAVSTSASVVVRP